MPDSINFVSARSPANAGLFAFSHRAVERRSGPYTPCMANSNLSAFIWSVADLLRGDYKQSEYGKVILPFTVLRRLDCVLEPTKAAVLVEKATREKTGLNPEPFLLRKAAQLFYNTSPLDLKKLMGDQDHIGENLRLPARFFAGGARYL